jgi:hypothetical protein
MEATKIKLKGTCPVCNGTLRKDVGPNPSRWANIFKGYDKETNTLPCNNCGSQYMFGTPKGEVNLRPDGTPCTHEYKTKTISNCYHRSTCIHCGDEFHIDSGD